MTRDRCEVTEVKLQSRNSDARGERMYHFEYSLAIGSMPERRGWLCCEMKARK